MADFILRYRDGPMKGVTEKKLRIGKGMRMSFGHGAKSTFVLDKTPGISETHAAIHNQGTLENPSLVLRRGQGKTQIWVHGLPKPRDFIDLPDKDIPVEHGMLIRMGKHTFEVTDPTRVAKPLNLVYEDGPLKGKFKPVKLAIASRNRMTIGHKKGASIPLPQGNGVQDSHAYIEKRFRRFQFEPELFYLVGDKGTTHVDSPHFPRYPINQGEAHELHHGTLIRIGPHTLRVVDPARKTEPNATGPKPASAKQSPTPPPRAAARPMAGLTMPRGLDEPFMEAPRKRQSRIGAFFTRLFPGWTPEARAEREEDRRMRKIWKNAGSELTYEQWRVEIRKEEERWEKEHEANEAQRRKTTDDYIHHLGQIGQYGPQAVSQGIKIDGSTKEKILKALNGVAWMDRRKGGTQAIHYSDVYNHASLRPAATQVFQLTQHPNNEVRKAARTVMEKFTTAFDYIHWHVEALQKKK